MSLAKNQQTSAAAILNERSRAIPPGGSPGRPNAPRVWVLSVGEPLPVDGPSARIFRAGTLAETLSDRSSDVVWWASAFDHYNKRFRSPRHATFALSDRLTLKMIRGCGYSKNVSIARLRDESKIARAFSQLAPAEPEPDVIVSCLPVPMLCRAALDYARPRGIPVLIDLRDKWPDLFLDLLPRGLRWAGRLGLDRMFRRTASVCREATGLVGVTESYLQWGLDYADRQRGPADAVMPIGYKRRRYSASQCQQAISFWRQLGISPGDGVFNACYFGGLGRQSALGSLIDACRVLHHQKAQVRVIVCGRGDFLQRYRKMAADLPNILFPGWIDAPKIQALMHISQVGLAPYREISNVAGHIPNKPPEYLSAGLPVVSSLQGEMACLLEEFNCGLTYRHFDSKGLARILTELADSPDRLEQMSHGALELFEARFNAENVYASYADHIAQVARSANRC